MIVLLQVGENDMKKKILGMVICTLVITTIIPVTGSEKSFVPMTSSADVDWWPMYHHDLSHTGYSTSNGPKQIVNWTKNFIGYLHAYSFAVVNDKLYCPIDHPAHSEYRRIICVDIKNGDLEWEFLTGNRIVTSSPAVVNGRVYVGTQGPGDPKVFCLDSESSTELWNYTLSADSSSSPCVYQDRVYLGAGRSVYCLNATTGAFIWQYHTIKNVISSPAVYDDKVYVGSGPGYGKMYCLDAEGNGDGTTTCIWEFRTGKYGDVTTSPAIVDNKVYFGSDDYKLYCLNAFDGTPLGNCTTGGQVGSPVVAYGNIYVGSNVPEYSVYCIDALGLTKKWNFSTENDEIMGLAVADQNVYVTVKEWSDPYQGARVYCLNASNGDVEWVYIIGGGVITQPVIADGKLYLCSDNGTIYCFGGENHPPSQPQKPVGPTRGIVGKSYLFSTMATDNIDQNDIQYGWDWDGNNVVDEWTDFYSSGETVETPHTWDTAGSFEVQVEARDRNNGTSDWSEPLPIIISYDLEIEEIKGGIFLRTTIANVGDINALNVPYSIKCDGGLILFPRGGFTEGEIGMITAGEHALARTFIFGFGRTNITIELKIADVITNSKTVPAFVFLFFINILEET
jgi:outer membrane protein assembly factor BamB